MTADNGDVGVLGIGTFDGRKETRGTDNVKGGDTKETRWVKGAGLLEDRGDNGDGRVDGIGDDENVSLWCGLGDGLSKVTDDTGIGLQVGVS